MYSLVLRFAYQSNASLLSLEVFRQFNVSQSLLPQLTTHQELWTFIVTNLASVYIREGNRHQEASHLTSYIGVPYFYQVY